MSREALKQKAAQLPDEPGVYLMKDARGVVLYVGKAKSLRERVSSYFHETPGDTRIKLPALLQQVADIEYIVAESEVDALLMEARLIKDIQPKYNENLRDDKLYPYLEITRSEDFPAVRVTRQRDNPKNKYYGPFTDARGLRQAVQILQPVFRFRTCSLEIRAGDPKRRFNRPCLLHYIERCTAPCADRVSRDDYLRQIDRLQRFLEGKRKAVVQSLAEEMQQCATALQYEKAAQIRDQIRAMEALAKRGSLDYFPEATQPPVIDPRDALEELQRLFNLPDRPRSIEGVDVAHLGGDEAVGSVVTFLDGKPFKSGYRRFRIRTVPGIDDYAMIGEIVERRFRRLDEEGLPFPDILLVDGGKGQLHAALERLDKLRLHPPAVASIAKREEIVYLGPSAIELRLKRNAPALRLLQYVRDEAHRFSVHYHHILRHKKLQAQI